jgi:hypothetical protein
LTATAIKNKIEPSAIITKNDYKTFNNYDPLKNAEFTPIADKLANRIDNQYCLIRSHSLRIVYRYTPTDLKVYGILTRYLGKDRKSVPFPKIKTIAERAKCSYSAARNSIAKLEADFVIYTRNTGHGKHYYFIPILGDGTPDQSSGEYQFAKAVFEQRELQKKQLRVVKSATQSCKKNNSHSAENDPKTTPLESRQTPTESTINSINPPVEIPCARAYINKQDKETNVINKSGAAPDRIKKVRDVLTKKYSPSISNQIINRGLKAYGLQFMLWLATRCQQDGIKSPVSYFCKGVNNREAYNEYDRMVVREGEKIETDQSEAHKKDIAKLAKEFSEKVETSEPSFEEKRVAFMDSVKEIDFLYDRYRYFTDEQLRKCAEFKNFKLR